VAGDRGGPEEGVEHCLLGGLHHRLEEGRGARVGNILHRRQVGARLPPDPLGGGESDDVVSRALTGEGTRAGGIPHFVRLSECVIDQTERRVLHGESVPAEDKIVSIYEEHTDVIVKDQRDTHFGHKLTLTGGRSGLILDWVVEHGNPPDSTLAVRMLERQEEISGPVPRQAAFDGGSASKANLKAPKELGVQDLAFSKKRGLEVLDMARSHWVYRRLRNFRAGIESWMKRSGARSGTTASLPSMRRHRSGLLGMGTN